MKLLGRTQMLSQYTILDSLTVIHGLGFDGVEICVERKDWSFNDLDSLPVDAIRERVGELGLEPHSFSLHQDTVYNDELYEMTKRAIAMTPQLGTNLFVFSGPKRRTGDEEEWRRTVERTRVLVQVAEEHDVILAEEFEPNFVVGTTAQLLRLFEEIPSPNLAANMDLGHAFICDPEPLEAIRQVGDRIVHCHIENMPAGVHDHLLPDEGDMDLVGYLRVLREVGFTGGMALDLYKYDYEAVAADAVRVLRDLIEQSR